MATTTTNFGWDIPQSTDLVKDGATAIAALGQDIDTALVDLKGGTTGQILAKASNTDLDYSWITNDVGDITAVTAGTGISGGGTSGAVTITNSMATAIDAKGDLIAGTGADTFDRLAVGATNDTVLTVDSTTATGLKYSIDWTTYTPNWSSYGVTQPTIGNGALVAQYIQIGKVVTVQMRIGWGSTTNSGSAGGYYFSLPKNAKVISAGVTGGMGGGYAEDAAVAGYVLPQIRIGGGGTVFEIITAGFGLLGSNSPFTFATGDFFQIQFSYGVA
jgi:hypothetical protein